MMNEYEVIEYVSKMPNLLKLRHYMNYFCNHLPRKLLLRTFEEFCSEDMVLKVDVGDNWQERGFASKKWITLEAGSIYHSVYHQLVENKL